MRKTALGLACMVLLVSCTVYTEKQSEALSQAVYLADDSFEAGRFDVTDTAIDQAVRIVKVPKLRQKIEAVTRPGLTINVEKTVPTLPNFNTSNNSLTPDPYKGKQILLVPERFKGQEVIVVNSQEYQKLLEDKKTFLQLQGDYKTLQGLKKTVDDELAKQIEYNNTIIIKINQLEKEVIAKNLLILKLYIVIGGLLLAIGGGVYLRMKGIL
jgi:hypothetical protein